MRNFNEMLSSSFHTIVCSRQLICRASLLPVDDGEVLGPKADRVFRCPWGRGKGKPDTTKLALFSGAPRRNEGSS